MKLYNIKDCTMMVEGLGLLSKSYASELDCRERGEREDDTSIATRDNLNPYCTAGCCSTVALIWPPSMNSTSQPVQCKSEQWLNTQ